MSSESHRVCPGACWMPCALSAEALAAHLAAAEPLQWVLAILFHCADVRLQVTHLHPDGVLTRVCPPSAAGRASRTRLHVCGGASSLAAALAMRLVLESAGHAVESLWPGVFAMAPATPIHLAMVATSLDCLATSIRLLIGGCVSLASICAWLSAMLFPFRSLAEMIAGTSDAVVCAGIQSRSSVLLSSVAAWKTDQARA